MTNVHPLATLDAATRRFREGKLLAPETIAALRAGQYHGKAYETEAGKVLAVFLCADVDQPLRGLVAMLSGRAEAARKEFDAAAANMADAIRRRSHASSTDLATVSEADTPEGVALIKAHAAMLAAQPVVHPIDTSANYRGPTLA